MDDIASKFIGSLDDKKEKSQADQQQDDHSTDTNKINLYEKETKESRADRLRRTLTINAQHPLKLAETELKQDPDDPYLLQLTAMAALLEKKPAFCLKYQKRLARYYIPNKGDHLLSAIASAQKGNWKQAAYILKKHALSNLRSAFHWFPGSYTLKPWLKQWVEKIKLEGSHPSRPTKKVKKITTREKHSKPSPPPPIQPAEQEPPPPELPEIKAEIPICFEWHDEKSPLLPAAPLLPDHWFRLRGEFAQLGLLQGFNELLCLSHLHNIETYWYQVEAVRKVLKQFRGRVLLADEVGLGKTVEAGMVLKEYLLRGMVERVLILTPASLVGQWQEEMESKFSIDFATTYAPLLRKDATAFWGQKRVIASIATARRKEHFDILTTQTYDLVIVDEAHHLKNRTTRNWKLVDVLKKRFLILLSATPVQNNLVELYNLLTLLKPGIFKTEKEFRSAYVTPRKPRLPINHGRLRDLMRDVMIRNTRSLVDVRLPPRQAITLRIDAEPAEKNNYLTLGRLIQDSHKTDKNRHRLAFRHMLTAAGSSPRAAQAALERFIARHKNEDRAWATLCTDYKKVKNGCKENALMKLSQQNPAEKKMIFTHHRETMNHLADLLEHNKIGHARFDGSMSGPEKDSAVERFRQDVPVLLCGESGGEGRNLQFCNTLINFDLPWNPMAIEQRIGRIHRIGQTREVFIFNLVVRETIEDRILQILDEKINMFELVVGEVGAILGEMDENEDFAGMVFSSWVESSEQDQNAAFQQLGERIMSAKQDYEAVKTLDENLFGNELESA